MSTRDAVQPPPWRRLLRPVSAWQWALDGVIIVLFALASFAASSATNPGGVLVTGGITALFVIALGVSRVCPPLALVVAWIAAVLQMACGLFIISADTAVFVVLFACAAYGSRRLFWISGASAVVGALLVPLYLLGFAPVSVSQDAGLPTWRHDGSSEGFLPSFLLVLGLALTMLVLAWTFGALFRAIIRARESRRAQVLAEQRAVAEEERGRIARDMHDIVAHSLAVVIAQADGARYAGASDPEAKDEALQTIAQTSRAALGDVRLLLTQLRHQQGEGPQPTLADLDELYARVRAAGVDLRVAVHPTPPGSTPTAVQLAIYRILQEATTNAMRHGDPGPVDVALAWMPDAVSVTVRSRRRRMPEPSRVALGPASSGHGLIGMRERAELIGGRFSAGPQGDSWVVQAWLPLGAA
ncbi:MAG: histidine kinase [Microbacterium sp.]